MTKNTVGQYEYGRIETYDLCCDVRVNALLYFFVKEIM